MAAGEYFETLEPKYLNFDEVECKTIGQSQKGQDSYIDYIFNKITNI